MKNNLPILEFDPTKIALINPDMIKAKHAPITKHLIICFFHEVIETLRQEKTLKHVQTLAGENPLPIYQFVDKPVTLIPGRLGAPACAGYLEDMIALGAKTILFCGGGGVLKRDMPVGSLIVVDSAIRDEGTSYHYLAPSREIRANPTVVSALSEQLSQANIEFMIGKTWTTDAFYRETPARIAKRQAEGAIIVEMEQAAMLAVSQFREVRYGAILYGGDDVSQASWDSRGWRSRHDVRRGLTELCATMVLKL